MYEIGSGIRVYFENKKEFRNVVFFPELWEMKARKAPVDACNGMRTASSHKGRRVPATRHAVRQDVPDLQGTDKQVEWAVKIRDVFLQKTETPNISDLNERLMAAERNRFLAQHIWAVWWIAHRDDLDSVVRDLHKSVMRRLCDTCGAYRPGTYPTAPEFRKTPTATGRPSQKGEL